MESETNLKNISEQENYVKWIYNLIKPYLGKDILEVGAGVGALTKHLEKNKRKILPIDKRTYDTNHSKSQIKIFDITKNNNKIRKKFDTIVCTNVIEHIKDDRKALENMKRLLAKKGKLILLVPSIKSIYGKIDKANNHYRRYSKKEIINKLKQEGYTIKKQKYHNFIGLIGWIYQNKILRSKTHRKIDLRRFNKFCPLFQKIESLISPPIGLSILIIAEKR